jgi:hypothetical protein
VNGQSLEQQLAIGAIPSHGGSLSVRSIKQALSEKTG